MPASNTRPPSHSDKCRRSVTFWKDKDQPTMLLTTIVALLPAHVLRQINKEYLAEVVGEGKLSVASLTAKIAQLVGEGRQRIDNHAARGRAGNENIDQEIHDAEALPDRADSIEPDRRLLQQNNRSSFGMISSYRSQAPDQPPDSSSNIPMQENPQVRSQEKKRPHSQLPILSHQGPCSRMTNNRRIAHSEQSFFNATKRPRIDSSYGQFIRAHDDQAGQFVFQPSPGNWGSQQKPIDLDDEGEAGFGDHDKLAATKSQKLTGEGPVIDKRKDNRVTTLTIPITKNDGVQDINISASDKNVQRTRHQLPSVQKDHIPRALSNTQVDVPEETGDFHLSPNAPKSKPAKRKPSGKIHTRPVANKTRSWQDHTIREISVTNSDMGRYGYRRPGNQEWFGDDDQADVL